VFSLASAFALFGERTEISKTARKSHPEWSEQTLHDKVSSAIQSNLIQAVIVIAIVLLLAKLIRDGKNWSRWVYTILSFIPLGDVLKVTGFFTRGHLFFTMPYGLTGLAAIVSIALLFVRPSSEFFRPGGASPFAAFLKPRARAQPTEPTAPAQPAPSVAAKRTAPRAKSRKANTE
jgi:hypothetical protein